MDKNPLEIKILRLLKKYTELNITQISNRLGRSRSTVTRYLKELEKEGVIQSRIANDSNPGKIPPKLYRIREN